MRTIGVVTVARSDYGIYLPILRRIEGDPDLRLILYVGGMHLVPEFGLTVQAIEEDGYEIAARVDMQLTSDTPDSIANSIGVGTIGFAKAFAEQRPDLLLVLGDRFEMLAAASAALPFHIPIAHIHGGELSEGAIDDAIRHAITKMSHLHFVAMEPYARRVRQMGEEEWRVVVSGAPGLDNLRSIRLLSRSELGERYGLDPAARFLLVTYHPVTLEYEQTETQVASLLQALSEFGSSIVFTSPNADTTSRTIIRSIQRFTEEHENAIFVVNLGMQDYFSMMKHADAMVGNSSSGIIEAASFELPVVNIGMRQRGRIRGQNVIDAGSEAVAILDALRRATSPGFRTSIKGMVNPYGDGHAAKRIVKRLKSVDIGPELTMKRFQDP